MKKIILLSLGALTLVVAIWFGFAWYRAHNKLVTLNVRNADLRKVIREIEWQTWERILVHQSMTNQVTLNVKSVPLHEVLNILSDQTSSRWSTFYPLYTGAQSLLNFKQSLIGGADPAQCGWTNLAPRGRFGSGGPGRGGGFGRGGGPGGMMGGGLPGNPVLQPSELVSMNCLDQDLSIAIMALARFGQTRVVPEDGTAGKVRLMLNNAPVAEAVGKLARQVKRKWTMLYAFEPERGGRGGDFAGGPPPWRGDGEGGPGRGRRQWMEEFSLIDTNGTNVASGTNDWAAAREQRRADMEQRMNDLAATMTAEQRQQWEATRNLSPEERQQRREAMFNSPEFQRMMQNRATARLLNTTPDQRVNRDRIRLERQYQRQMREQQRNAGR